MNLTSTFEKRKRGHRKSHRHDLILSGYYSYIRVLGVIELIEFNHSGLFGVVG
jgi:hypothetical protein